MMVAKIKIFPDMKLRQFISFLMRNLFIFTNEVPKHG